MNRNNFLIIFLVCLIFLLFGVVCGFMITDYQRITINENSYLNINQTYLIAMGFVSLIVAIIAFIGVGNVHQIIQTKEKFNDEIKEFNNKLNKYETKINNFKDKTEKFDNKLNKYETKINKNEKEIQSISKIIIQTKKLVDARAYLDSFIMIQVGFSYNDRLTAAHFFKEDIHISNHSDYFKYLLSQEEKMVPNELSEDEIINRKAFINILNDIILRGEHQTRTVSSLQALQT